MGGDGGDSDDGVLGIPPLKLYGTVTVTAFSAAAGGGKAGRKPCKKGVQRERLAHCLACKV
ncbi:MAG: hypothetical protein ACLUBT_05445 [[Clostridium] leptum]